MPSVCRGAALDRAPQLAIPPERHEQLQHGRPVRERLDDGPGGEPGADPVGPLDRIDSLDRDGSLDHDIHEQQVLTPCGDVRRGDLRELPEPQREADAPSPRPPQQSHARSVRFESGQQAVKTYWRGVGLEQRLDRGLSATHHPGRASGGAAAASGSDTARSLAGTTDCPLVGARG